MGLSLEASATKSEHTFQEEDPGFQHLNLLTLLSRVTFHLSPLARNGPEEHSMRARSHGTAPRGIHASPLARNGSKGHSMRARSHGTAPRGIPCEPARTELLRPAQKPVKTCAFCNFWFRKLQKAIKNTGFSFWAAKKQMKTQVFAMGGPKLVNWTFAEKSTSM
jgi:hypothetical protein